MLQTYANIDYKVIYADDFHNHMCIPPQLQTWELLLGAFVLVYWARFIGWMWCDVLCHNSTMQYDQFDK